MSTDAAQVARSSARVTVVGPGGPEDLVVPLWMTVADLAAAYAERTGAPAPALVTAAGEPLPTGQELQDLGVESGSVLVVASGGARVVSTAGSRTARPDDTSADATAATAERPAAAPSAPVVRVTQAGVGGAGG